MNFALTEKLKKIIKPEAVVDLSQTPHIDTWFCNYFAWRRKKWLIMINAETLITVFKEDVTATEIRKIQDILNDELEKTENSLGLELKKLKPTAPHQINFGKTFDKRTLSILNEQVKAIKAFLEVQGIKREKFDKTKLIKFLNNNIFKNKVDSNYSSPLEIYSKSS